MLLRRVVHGVGVLCLGAWLAVAAVASEYHGQVTFSGQPLPGSTVTVTATQGDKKAVAVSDDQGIFAFPDLADGKWTLTIEMTGFAPLKQEVTIAPGAQPATFELKLLSLDQIRAEDKPVKVDTTQLAMSAPAAVSVQAAAPAAAGGKAAAAGASQSATTAPPPPPAVAQQASDGLLINGSQSNAATSQFSMNAAFGNNRNSHSLYNGNAFFQISNSALDATPYSLSGQPVAKPQFNNYTLGFQFAGPLNIKHVMPRGPYFRVNYTHSENNTFSTLAALIPTGEVLTGVGAGSWNLSVQPGSQAGGYAGPIYVPAQLTQPNVTSSQCLAALPGATSPDPAGTGRQVFTNNVIPASCIAAASQQLLRLYPQTPNVLGDTQYNYQVQQSNPLASDSLGFTLQKQFGNKNNVHGGWNFTDSRGTNVSPNIFGYTDTNATLGMTANIGYYHQFTQRLQSALSYNFSRQRNQLIPTFANKNNIEGAPCVTGQSAPCIAGASGASQYWGPPTLNFASSIASPNDGTFSYNRNETNGITEDLTWSRMRHNVQFGGGFNRLEFNYLSQSNPDGTLSFTGAATQATTAGGTTLGGSDLADFLLGLPDTSGIAYGNADKYLRQNTSFLYVNDDFRVNPELTVNAGLRWEYGSPASELKGRLVNLDVGQNFSTATPVTGSNPLLQADYSRPEPRVSLAWRPISGSSLLIHSGYAITNDTSVYQQPAYAMAQEAPLSTSLNLSTGCPFNLSQPFVTNANSPACTPATTGTGRLTASIPQTFAIDPNFRVGYVQTWQFQLQRDLPFSMQLVATYTGIKGTHGVQEFLPNTCPPVVGNAATACDGNPHGYIYRTSNGNLERNAATIDLRRRLRNGFEARVIYTYAKSLDDDYSLGAQGSVTNGSGIAQDWTNLRGQRGLSNGDQRNLINVTAQYTTGMGIGGHALMSGWRGVAYKDWTVNAIFSAGSGLPETPIYAGATVTGASVYGTIRPDVIGSPRANLAPGYFVNQNAYALPAAGYGNARRNSIEGPDTFSLNANMVRTFRLRGRYSLDAQLNATNVLNHVVYTQWNTNWTPPVAVTAGSTAPSHSSFGAPVAAGQMRQVSLALRMRF